SRRSARSLMRLAMSVALDLVDDHVSTPGDVDLGARVGLRWPVGPFEYANRVGLDTAARLVDVVRKTHDLGPSPLLARQSTGEPRFSLDKVRLDVRDGVARIRLNRPDQLNALDPESVEELEQRFDDASARNDVRGIVISGAGKAFVAGADVKFFVDAIERGDLDAIEAFSARGQRLFRRIETSTKPVVAVLAGMALGGGAELALACHVRIATDKATMAFPETSLGIYPGLGGTQRLTRQLGRGLARYLICTGRRLPAALLYELGLVHEVVAADAVDAAIARWLAVESAPRRPSAVPSDLARMGEYLAQISVVELASGRLTLPGGDDIRDLVQKLQRQAPLALAEVERLTALALEVPIEDGLAAESAGIRHIFGTADALEGMRALLEGRRAKFTGR
ncbi:MAG: enoyl-CoA hydratase-related protein, partial [Myxococcota bacterium]